MQLISRSWNLFRGIAGLMLSIFEHRNPEALLEAENRNLSRKAVALAFALCGLFAWESMPGSSYAQDRNGVVQLRDEQTIIIEGPLLGGQAERFAQIVTYLHQSERREFTVYINSEGGSFDEVNRIIGAMQEFQRRGGLISTVVPQTAICWSFCPMIFSFGDRRFADDETSWMFHRPVPDSETEEIFTSPAIDRAIEAINEFWLDRLRIIDPKFADLRVRNWLRDGAEHKISGSELRRLSSSFFNRISKEMHEQLGRSTPLTRP